MTRTRTLRIGLWIVLGIALRFVALGADGLWVDEGYTAWTSFLPAGEHREAQQSDDAPPVYYALQRLILPHLPPGEASVRLLSAAAGTAGIAWLVLAPPLRSVAEAPAALMALGAYGVFYGRQARSYALLLLWSLVLVTATARVLEGRRRWLPVVALAEALALLTHNVAANLVVGANLAWLLCGRRDPLRWFAAQAAALLLWLPYLIHALPQFAVHSALNRWIGDYWKTVPLPAGPALSLASFTSGARVDPAPPTQRWFYEGPGSSAVTVLALAAVLVLLIFAFRKEHRREALFAAAFTLGPLFSITVLSLVAPPSYIVSRTDAVAYAGFILWASVGLKGLSGGGGVRRWTRIGALAILIASSSLTYATRFPVAGRSVGNDRDVGQALYRETRPGDWVAFIGLSRPSIDYYLSSGRPGRPDPAIRRVHFPAIFGANPAAVYPIPADSLDAWHQEALRLRAGFEASVIDPDRYLYIVGVMKPEAALDPSAADLTYPGSLLAFVVNGLRPLEPLARVHGDGMGIDWVLFRVRRDRLVPLDSLPGIEARP